jgi:hypothetical protein
MAPATPTDVSACGTDGQMFHYDGSSWTLVPHDTKQTLQGIWGALGQRLTVKGQPCPSHVTDDTYT